MMMMVMIILIQCFVVILLVGDRKDTEPLKTSA